MHQRKASLWRTTSLLSLGFSLLLTGCDDRPKSLTPTSSPPAARTENDPIPTYGYEVVAIWPHDRSAFTQGLVYFNGKLLESTGLKSESTLREVDLNSGEATRKRAVPAEYFAEGLALLGGKLYQLTWQE